MIVRLKDSGTEYPDLTAGQPYMVIGIEADDYRILNDQGRPYLFPHHDFEVLDSSHPLDWVREIGDDQEEYAYPSAFSTPGFFEDFFDDNEQAVTTFWRELNHRLVTAAA